MAAELHPPSSVARPLALRLADRIREAVLSGELKAGEPINQALLAARYGVSHVPLREALRNLESEGLVSIQPYRGAILLPLSAEEAREIFEVRDLLDNHLLRLAFPALTADVLDRAEGVARMLRTENDARRHPEIAQEFWEVLFTPADRPFLLGLVRQVHRSAQRYWKLYAALGPERPDTRGHFFEVVGALRRRDLEQALGLVRQTREAMLAAVIAQLCRAARAPG
jgi:DNA-binding GntR family transcriptional regulator